MSEYTRVVEGKIGKDKYLTRLSVAKHQLQSDEPEHHQGKDLGPGPSELLLAALGSCTLITIRMYADRKEWDLQAAEVELEISEKETEKDGVHTKIERKLKLSGNLDEAQENRLLQIAGACPVAKILTGEVSINSELKA